MGMQLNASCDPQGYLVCQMPKDMVEVELKVKTKCGKFTLTKDFHSRTEKCCPWNMAACRARIHTYKHRTPHQIVAKTYESNMPNSTDSDSSTQIITGEGIGYPPKVYTDPRAHQPPTDSDIEEQQILFKDYCRTCISQRPRCVCQPTSDRDEDPIDLRQTILPITRTIKTYAPNLMTSQTKKIIGMGQCTRKLDPRQVENQSCHPH